MGHDFPRGRSTSVEEAAPRLLSTLYSVPSSAAPSLVCLFTDHEETATGESVSEAQPSLSYIPHISLIFPPGRQPHLRGPSKFLHQLYPSFPRWISTHPLSLVRPRPTLVYSPAIRKNKRCFSSPSISPPCETGVSSFPTDPISIFASTPTNTYRHLFDSTSPICRSGVYPRRRISHTGHRLPLVGIVLSNLPRGGFH